MAVDSDNTSRWIALRRFSGSAFGQLLALFAVIVFFALMDDGGTFLTIRNLRTTTAQTATVAVAALGMTVLIIAGGIDLSAGTAVSLSACVLALGLKSGLPGPVAIAAGILTGCAAGLLNGLLINVLRVVPFIVTLGTMTLYLGLAKRVAGDGTIRPGLEQVPGPLSRLLSPTPDAIYPLAWFHDSASAASPSWSLAAISFPVGIWLALGLAGGLAIVLHYTVFGRYVFALGSSEATARLCGINVPFWKTAVYALGGLFVGIAGVYQFSRLSSGNPTSGTGMELKIIAAVVIGGGSLSGGRGSVLGTLSGAAIMAVISSGCTQLGIKNPEQDMLLGGIIIAAVALDQFRQRRSE